MANVLFNELSVSTAANGLAEILLVLAEDIKFLNGLKIGKVVFHTGAYERLAAIFFDADKRFLGVVNQLDREKRLLISHFLTSTRALGATNQKHTETSTGSAVDYLASYLDLPSKAGAVSFRNKTSWFEWQLIFIDCADPRLIFPLNHLAFLPQKLLECSAQLEKFILSLPPEMFVNCRGVDCLPRGSLSSFYFSEIKILYENAQKLDRISAHTIVGTTIAKINGYQSCPELNKINKNGNKIRHIFYNPELEIHLSIDIMHGAFEVCSKDGSHLWEISFLGKKLSDAAADHSIRTA